MVEDNKNFSLQNYMQNPIYIKNIKLHQLYEFPFLSTKMSLKIYNWVKARKYFSHATFKKFLNDDELYDALKPFIAFEKNRYFVFSNQYLKNSYNSNYLKTKFYGKYKKHSIYFRNLNYKQYTDKLYWSYNWHNEIVNLRLGRFSIKTPLKLLSGGSSFFNRANFHPDAIYGTLPHISTNSSDSQLSGLAANFHIFNSEIIVYSSKNELAVKTDSTNIIDYYSNPFLSIKEDHDSKQLNFTSYGFSFWKKLTTSFAFNMFINSQKLEKSPFQNPQISPHLYYSRYSYSSEYLYGTGLYYYSSSSHHEIELHSAQNKKISYICKHSFKPENNWIFELTHFYYSPYI
ncbi:MAG: hypothetical protein KAR38_11265, partial [Calditrichia bacterium]|nr:hypothetical protein [Calditrichia bacterium]